MASLIIPEEELRDSDVLELFIDLLNKEKKLKKITVSDFDIIMLEIKKIKDFLDSMWTTHNGAYTYTPLLPITTHEILFNLFIKYSFSKEENFERGAKLKERKYQENFEYFLDNAREYIKPQLDLVYNEYVKNAVNIILEKYLNFFESFGFIKDPSFNKNFLKYLKYLVVVLEKSDELKIQEDSHKLTTTLYNIIRPFFPEVHNKERDRESIVGLGGSASTITDIYNEINNTDIAYTTAKMSVESLSISNLIPFRSDDAKLSNTSSKYIVKNEGIDFYMSITVSNYLKPDTELFLSIYLIMKSLTGIKGINLELVDIRKGSLKAAIRGTAKDIVASEEAKAVLRNAIEIAGKKITGVSVATTNKSYAEIDKIKAETETIEQQLKSQLDPEDIKYKAQLGIEKDILSNQNSQADLELKRLAIEKAQLENKGIKLDNIRKELDNVKELSEMCARGIIQVDMVRVEINGLPIIVKEGGRLEIGNIDEAMK